jgi:ribose-phosphate pyrophosphokinase
MESSIAIIDKRRTGPNEAKIMNIVGDIEGKTALLLDDMVDTAGTLTQAASALAQQGVRKIAACCVHPVLSGKAVQKINNSPLEEVVVTNTILLRQEASSCSKIKVLTVGALLSEAIKRIHSNDSVSSLFI